MDRVTECAEANNFGLVDMRFVKPLDEQLLLELSNNYRHSSLLKTIQLWAVQAAQSVNFLQHI